MSLDNTRAKHWGARQRWTRGSEPKKLASIGAAVRFRSDQRIKPTSIIFDRPPLKARVLELASARLRHNLVLVIPDNFPGITRCQDFDVDAAGLHRKPEPVHLSNMFNSNGLEPGQAGLPTPLPAASRKLSWNSQVLNEPRVDFREFLQRP